MLYTGSLSVNVSTSSVKNEYLNTEQLNVNGASHTGSVKLLSTSIAIVLVYILSYATQLTTIAMKL